MRFIVPLVILLTTSWVAWGGRVTMDPNGPLSRTVKETLDPCPGYVPGDSPLVGIEETIRNTLDPCYGMVPIGEGNPDPDPPTVPSSLSVVPDGNTLGVQGVPSDDATFLGYRWCEGAGCTSFTNEVHVISKTVVYQIENLEWDTTYEAQARSEGQYGNSPWTSSVAGITGSDPDPGTPNIPDPTNLAVYPSYNSAGVFWNGESDSEISICTGSSCSNYGSTVSIPEANGSFYNITGLAASTTYGVQVVATDGSNSSNALTGSFTTPVAPTGPYDPPVPVFGIGVTDTTLTFIPSGISNFETFDWRTCEDAGCNSSGETTELSSGIGMLTGLTPGTVVGVRARAYGPGGTSAFSFPRIYVTTDGGNNGGGDPTGPPAPVNVVVSEATTSISMTWQSGGGDTASYGYSMCTGVSCSSFGGITPVASTSVNITGLTADTTYGFRIYSYDSGSTVSSEYASATGTTNPLVAGGGQCVDGVDCRCDVLVSAYGADVVFCEDFEDSRLTEQGVWQKNPSSLQGAGWKGQGYTGITGGCAFTDDNGTVVPPGGSVYGAAQIVNTDRCIELNDAARQSAIPGISAFQVFDGNITMAQLNQPANAYPELPPVNGQPDYQTGGLHGAAQLDRPVKTFGVTRAVLTTSNVEETGVAWKDDQWTVNNFGIWGTVNPITPSNPPVQPCTTPAGGWDMYPFAGTVWNWGGVKSTYTEVEGHGCDTGKLKHYPDTTTYTPPASNTWVCQQFAYTDWGEDDMRFRYWQDGELLIDLQDIDATSAQTDVNLNGMDQFSWNNYFNGASGDSANQGYEGTTYSGRLKDNVVVKEGEPVPCTEIGFDPPPSPPLASCTDGVDCRCDELVSVHGSDIVFCEDFENPTLGDPGVWQTTGGGWDDQSYSGINNYCKGIVDEIPLNATPIPNNDATNNNGCIYLLDRDDASTQPGFGTAQFSNIPVADQTFDGNVTLMQTVRPPDVGFTVTAEDGTLYPLQQPGGFHGDVTLDRLVTNFGITSARYTAAGVDNGTIAWKGNQFTPANSAFTGTFNTTSCSPDATGMGTNLEPYSGTLWRFATAADAPGSYTNTVGNTCAPTNSTSLKSAPAARATPLMPRGEWVCQQIEYDNWGQADGRVRHWIDGELIIDVAIDMTSMLSGYQEGSGDGLLRFKWNNYYNGNSLGGSWNWDAGGQTPTTPGYPLATKNQGYPGTTWSGRLQDNMVIKEGSPVSCAEIGFTDPTPPIASTCTDGVDCLCDVVPNALFCEDFQAEELYDPAIAGNWVDSSGNGERASGSHWTDTYGFGGLSLLWQDGEPNASPTVGIQCDSGTSNACNGVKEYCSENQGNYGSSSFGSDCFEVGDKARYDVQSVGDSSEFIPGESDPTGGTTQNRWMAQSASPDIDGGIAGLASWTAQADVGMTIAMAFPTNSVSTGVLSAPWKFNEFGPQNRSALMGFSSSPTGLYEGFPYQGFITPDTFGSACTGLLAGITGGTETGNVVGEVFCDTRFRWRWDESDTTYRQSTDWPLGTFGCYKTRMTDVGTSDTCVTQWNGDDTVVIDFCGLDTTGTDLAGGVGQFQWNAYSNAWQASNLTSRAARYEDNFVITGGEPVSCETIGFD